MTAKVPRPKSSPVEMTQSGRRSAVITRETNDDSKGKTRKKERGSASNTNPTERERRCNGESHHNYFFICGILADSLRGLGQTQCLSAHAAHQLTLRVLRARGAPCSGPRRRRPTRRGCGSRTVTRLVRLLRCLTLRNCTYTGKSSLRRPHGFSKHVKCGVLLLSRILLRLQVRPTYA